MSEYITINNPIVLHKLANKCAEIVRAIEQARENKKQEFVPFNWKKIFQENYFQKLFSYSPNEKQKWDSECEFLHLNQYNKCSAMVLQLQYKKSIKIKKSDAKYYELEEILNNF